MPRNRPRGRWSNLSNGLNDRTLAKRIVSEQLSPTRSHARILGKAIVAVGAAIAITMAWLAIRSPTGPSYRGKSAGYYFPRWESRHAESDGESRWPDDAGADAVPFLVQVLRTEDSPARKLFLRAWEKLPSRLGGCLPLPQDADSIRSDAFGRLLTIAHSTAGMVELAKRFDSLPVEVQEGYLNYFTELPALSTHTVPLLKHTLESTNCSLKHTALSTLLALGSPSVEHLPRILQILEEDLEGDASADLPWAVYSRLLGRLGSDAKPATPLLLNLTKSAFCPTRINAGLALIRIEPGRQSFKDFFDREVASQGSTEVARFVEFLWHEAQIDTSPLRPEDALPVLQTLLDESYVTNLLWSATSTNTNRAHASAMASATRSIHQRAIVAVAAFGSNAAPAVPHLTPLLSHRAPEVRLAAARALQKIGPVAPASVPQLLSALPDGGLHEPLVELLGGYGLVASKAIPDLQAMTAGRWRPHWSNAPSEYESLMMERYGLIPKGSAGIATTSHRTKITPSLQKAAKMALQRIERQMSGTPEVDARAP